MLVIKTKISFKEYAKLLFSLAYKKPVMIFLVSMAILNGVWIICHHFVLLDISEPKVYQYFGLLLISVVQPAGIFFMIWRNYATNIHLRETLELNFTKDQIKLKAEGFTLESLWSKMYKIIELQYWFVIYQNSLSAIIIPKKSFQQTDMEEFKQILLSIKEIQVKLKI